MDAGRPKDGEAEQSPSLHLVNENFFAKFNAARTSKVAFQQAARGLLKITLLALASLNLAVIEPTIKQATIREPWQPTLSNPQN